MQGTFAEAVKEDWIEMCTGGMAWDRYARDNLPVLCLWCSRQDLLDTIAHKEDFPAVAQQVRRLVGSCSALRNMLSSAWETVARSCWQDDIKSKIRDLEHEDFSVTAMSGFKDCMMLSAKVLMKKAADKKYKKYEVSLSFAGKDFEMEVGSASEQWQLMVDLRLMECALQSDRVPFLPWETLFWSKGSLPDVPEHARIPDEFLLKMRSAREFCCEHVHSGMNIADMIGAIKSKEKILCKMFPSFRLCIHMLRSYTQHWCEQEVHARAKKRRYKYIDIYICMKILNIFSCFFLRY